MVNVQSGTRAVATNCRQRTDLIDRTAHNHHRLTDQLNCKKIAGLFDFENVTDADPLLLEDVIDFKVILEA